MMYEWTKDFLIPVVTIPIGCMIGTLVFRLVNWVLDWQKSTKKGS